MDIHAQKVAGAVQVVALVGTGCDKLVDIALQQTELHQTAGQRPAAGVMDVFDGGTRNCSGDTLQLGRQHYVVKSALRRRKARRLPRLGNRIAARDVGSKAVPLAASVDKEDLSCA